MPGALSSPSAACGIRPTAELLAEYLFIDVLGSGKYGTVWKCRERCTGREFACKQIALSTLDRRAWKVAVREIDVLIRMRGAENVVSLEGVFGDATSLYLLLELCDGGDLLSQIEREGPLPEREARRVFASVVRGVRECHVRGIIHRDIKPENILLCPIAPSETKRRQVRSCDFVPKLADFGLALPLPEGHQVVGYAGSFPYEAPEVLAREPYDESADIWSLGVLLFATLSASWPAFDEGDADRRIERAVDWRAGCWAGVSAEAKALIARMMAVDAEERPSAAEILEDPWLVGEACMADDNGPLQGCFTPRTRGNGTGSHVELTIAVGCGEEGEEGVGMEVWEIGEGKGRDWVRKERWGKGEAVGRREKRRPFRHVACRSPRGHEQCMSPGEGRACVGG